MLGQGREEVPNLGHGELAFGQPDHQPMLLEEEKNLMEVVHMRGKISAEDEDVVNIHKTER